MWGAGVWGWRAGCGESLGLRVSGARAGCTDHNWREFRVKGFRSQDVQITTGESLGLRVSGARAGCTDHNWREFRVKGFRSQGWMYRSQLDSSQMPPSFVMDPTRIRHKSQPEIVTNPIPTVQEPSHIMGHGQTFVTDPSGIRHKSHPDASQMLFLIQEPSHIM